MFKVKNKRYHNVIKVYKIDDDGRLFFTYNPYEDQWGWVPACNFIPCEEVELVERINSEINNYNAIQE